MKMKRFLGLMLSICLMMTSVPTVLAESSTEETSGAVTLASSYPQENKPAYYRAGSSTNPVNTVTLNFSGEVSDTALQTSSYSVTGGKNPVTVTGVTKIDNSNAYKLKLSGTETNVKYTVSFAGVKDSNGNALAKTSYDFYSVPMLLDASWTLGERSSESNIVPNCYMFCNSSIISFAKDENADSSPVSSAVKVTYNVNRNDGYAWTCRICMGNGEWNYVRVEKGKKYAVSFRYKSEEAVDDAYVLPCTGNTVAWNADKAYFNNTEWQDYYTEFISAESSTIDLILLGDGNMKDKSVWFDDIKVYEIPTYGVASDECTPSDGSCVMPTDTLKIKFTGPMSSTAENQQNYEISGVTGSGQANEVSVSSVKNLDGNEYELKLSAVTDNMASYTVKVNNVTDCFGNAVSGGFSFFSGEQIITEQHFNKGDNSVATGWNTATVMPFWKINGNGISTVTIDWDADETEDSAAAAFKINSKFTETGEGTDYSHPYRLGICYESWTAKKLINGKTYNLQFRYKIDTPDTETEIKIIHPWPMTSTYPTFKFNSTEWQMYNETFTASITDGVEGALQILLDESFVGKTIYLDDIKLSTPLEFVEPTAECTPGEVGTNSVKLTFNNDMNESAAVDTSNYSIDGADIESIKKIDGKNYTVYFKSLDVNREYTLNITGLKDIYLQTLDTSCTFTVVPENKLYFDDVKFYVNYGKAEQYEILDGCIADGDVTAVTDNVMNYSGEEKKLRLFIAYYKDGALESVKTESLTATNGDGSHTLATGALNIPEKVGDTANREVKAFLLDDKTYAPICEAASLADYTVTHISVALDGSADYTSPMAANEAVSGNSATNRFVIDIAPGVYETYDEDLTWYRDSNRHGSAYGWTVKAYVTLKGTDKDECKIVGKLPDNHSLTAQGRNEITLYSTLNLFWSCTLENLTITAENMRYPIHDEGSNNNKKAVHIMKNCHIEHLGTAGATNAYIESLGLTVDQAKANGKYYDVWQWASPYGYGSGSGVVAIFENSEFKSETRGWYVHSNSSFQNPQVNILNNCVMNATTSKNDLIVESLGSGTKDSVVLNNATFNGVYMSYNDSPWCYTDMNGQYADHAEYQVVINNSDPIGISNNQRGKALAVYSNDTTSASAVRVTGNAANAVLGSMTARKGGGGANGYTYGYYDISGIKVGLGSNIVVNNTIGRRLGDCSTASKTMTFVFDGDEAKTATVQFNKNYTDITNSAIIAEINSAISAYGYVGEYNVSVEEYYPSFPDKEFTMTNNTDAYIPRFAAICLKDGKYVQMTSEDSADSFAGIALERMVPGASGRVLKQGYLSKSQLGMTSDIAVGTSVTLNENGKFVAASGNESGLVMSSDKIKNWVLFSAE